MKTEFIPNAIFTHKGHTVFIGIGGSREPNSRFPRAHFAGGSILGYIPAIRRPNLQVLIKKAALRRQCPHHWPASRDLSA